VDERLRTVRLVSERYAGLQGLRLVVIGAAYAVVFGVVLILGPVTATSTLMIAIAIMFAIVLPSQWLLTRYYESRFGRIVPPFSGDHGLWISVGTALAVTITDKMTGAGALAGGGAIAAGAALWIVIRDWPLRSYHLLGGAACAVGVSLQFLAANSTALPRAQATAFVIVGLAYILVGVLDHRLLTSVLRPRQSGGAQTALTDATKWSGPDTG
jgi:hypothetical protein